MNLKIVLTITIAAISLTSCKEPKPKEEDSELEHKTEKTLHSIRQGDVEILTIDDCQYIVYKEAEGANHSYGYMAHKGNCNNPIHCYQTKEMDTIRQPE